jgi:hypothetical protein
MTAPTYYPSQSLKSQIIKNFPQMTDAHFATSSHRMPDLYMRYDAKISQWLKDQGYSVTVFVGARGEWSSGVRCLEVPFMG